MSDMSLPAQAASENTKPDDAQSAPGASTQPAPALDLTDIGTLRRLLAKHGLEPNKSFGQNFLLSRRALRAILQAAELHPDESVLEVGAGTGLLTIELAQRARRVVAVELDRAILPLLRETTAPYPNVEILPRDVLTVRPEDVFGATPYKVVANLPYYITSLILRHLLEAANPPRRLVVMVQREVAERMVAGPGDLSLLGLSVQFFGRPEIVAYVPPGAFYPPPKVESAVVRIDVYPEPLLPPEERNAFFGIAHAGFSEKRKQIHNSLARNLHVAREEVAEWLAQAHIDPMRRPQTLSLDEWLALTRLATAANVQVAPEDAEAEVGEL